LPMPGVGKIYIGIEDAGNVVGVKNIKKLMEDLPNKIQSGLGIIADVNKLEKDSREYMEIKVESSSYPVNYHGEYHYRSGATKQLLQGAALTEFIREKTGFLWDAVPVDNIGVDDLGRESIDILKREAVRKKRITKDYLDISDEELMDHLDLLEGGRLKRAAVMLFYRKPGRIITGCYVKIGKFGEGSDLQYQDIVEGSLFNIADKVIDLIYTKYLKAKISYEYDVRVETYSFPREGVREAIYNVLGHNNYAASIPIQIRIEEEAMYISNNCILPHNWTVVILRHGDASFRKFVSHAENLAYLIPNIRWWVMI
jgi:ATP-dependent DNA helicase RecG